MEIINVEQKSEAWFKLREKRMTASHAQAIGNCGKGLESYVTGLMEEFYSSKPKESFSNKHTDRGNELEDSAAFLYSAETGNEVENVGFVIHNDFVGCSPDLFTGEKGLVEIKCPDDKEFFRRLLGGLIKPEYIWQMQCQMLICEKEYCDHVEYNPNYLKNLIITRIEPDLKKFESLEEGFKIGEQLIKEIELKMLLL